MPLWTHRPPLQLPFQWRRFVLSRAFPSLREKEYWRHRFNTSHFLEESSLVSCSSVVSGRQSETLDLHGGHFSENQKRTLEVHLIWSFLFPRWEKQSRLLFQTFSVEDGFNEEVVRLLLSVSRRLMSRPSRCRCTARPVVDSRRSASAPTCSSYSSHGS